MHGDRKTLYSARDICQGLLAKYMHIFRFKILQQTKKSSSSPNLLHVPKYVKHTLAHVFYNNLSSVHSALAKYQS